MTRSIALIGIALLFTLASRAQTSSFFNLRRPEKLWVLTHPFKAHKAYRISMEVRKVCTEVAKDPRLDSFEHGGRLDAFRHCYWMSQLGCGIGVRAARKLGKAHEKSNYLSFKHAKTVDSALQDSNAVVMDLHNNEIGLQLVIGAAEISNEEMREKIIGFIQEGRLLRLKTDSTGKLLHCDGSPLQPRIAKEWSTPTCLINSNL